MPNLNDDQSALKQTERAFHLDHRYPVIKAGL